MSQQKSESKAGVVQGHDPRQATACGEIVVSNVVWLLVKL